MVKNVLVTGGAGFIGSNTVDLLVSKGYNVIVLDNLSTGKRGNINKTAKFVLCDILDINRRIKTFMDVDAIIHCAAQISVVSSVNDPKNDALNNVIGTLNMLELCRKFDIKKFILASTGGAMYGSNTSRLPFKERLIEQPESPYAIAKRSAELYMDYYNKIYGIDCVSMRYSNVFGPRQDHLGEAGVIAIFINRLLRNQRPIIFGNGSQTRDFIYVEDVAKANMLSLTQKTISKKFNIGTGKQTTVNDILHKIKLIMGKENIKPLYEPSRPGELSHSCVDISLAKKELCWNPKTSLGDGLKRTIEWFCNNKKKLMSAIPK